MSCLYGEWQKLTTKQQESLKSYFKFLQEQDLKKTTLCECGDTFGSHLHQATQFAHCIGKGNLCPCKMFKPRI